MWKRFLNDYLSYTHKERTGIIVLLALIMICLFIPFIYPYLIPKKQTGNNKFDKAISQLQLIQPDTFGRKKYASENSSQDDFSDYNSPSGKHFFEKSTAEVFYFDPNTTTAAEWKRLGIKDRTIATIQKYISKGGHFYKPEDINRIWGFHAEDIDRLLPYVKIAGKESIFTKAQSAAVAALRPTSYVPKTFTIPDINMADTTAFISLPGIGSKLAQRIINFRDRLGGFYSVAQVAETFGLPDSTFQKIKSKLVLSNSSVKKMNINVITLDELKTHPYIRYNLANAIIQYRNQHGNFLAIADIKKIMLVTEDAFKKMEPYLKITD